MSSPVIRIAATVTILALYGHAQTVGRQPNMLPNDGFEEVDDTGAPAGWEKTDYRTGGVARTVAGQAHAGDVAIALGCASGKQRACWRRKVAWPAEERVLACGGVYRTIDAASTPGRGTSIRVLFHRSLGKWDEIGLKQTFFPVASDWRPADAVFTVPEGAAAVVVEFFHFYAAGETQWDDVWLRPATETEIQDAMTAFEPGTEPDRPPVPGRNRPYSPADGETVALNPPPFLWLPSGRDAEYRLQVSRDATFASPGTIRTGPGPWCCEMLTHELTPGTWHWRYGVDRGGFPTVWSHVRRFVVPVTASSWPYAGRDAFRVSEQRPRMFVREGRLPELRKRVQDGDLADIAQALLRNVVRHAGEELVPEPDFLPEDRAERGKAYTLTFRRTRPPMDLMEQAGLAYLLTGDAACGAEAKRRILHFFAWDPSGSTNVFHNDEPAMWIMMRGVRAYDWTHALFSDAERAAVEKSMRVRATDFYRKMSRMPFENNPFESHAGRIIGFLGEAAISFLSEWPEAREWLDYITRIYWGVYPAWGKDDGGWNEGPGYWSAYMSFGLHFVVALREATGVDLSQRPFFKSTPYYKLYVSPPYSRMSPFGDGTQFKPSQPAELMYWFSTLNQDPRIRWYPDTLGRDSGNSILGVVLKDDDLAAMPPIDLPQGRLFEGVGLACLHTDFGNGDNDVTFVMRSSPYGAVSHGHNDQNCFVLEAYGEPLAIATGHYNRYGSPHHDKWTRQTKAKCGITYDGGKSQDRGWYARGRIESFVHGEAIDLIVGDATEAYGGRLGRARREVVQLRPGVFVIRDDLASAEPHRYEFQLHALDQMAVDESTQTVLTHRPNASLHTRFLCAQPVTFAQTNAFDPPVAWPPDREFEDNWHLTAALRNPQRETEFVTVLSVTKMDARDRVAESARIESASCAGARLTLADGGSALVGFRRPGAEGTMQLEGVRSDGSAFAVVFAPDGAPRNWLLGKGTSLEAGGTVLVRSSHPTSVTACIADDGGRIDTDGPGEDLAIHWPDAPTALTRDGDTVKWSCADSALKLEMAAGRDSVQVWTTEPVAPGPVAIPVTGVGTEMHLTGQRYGRGSVVASGVFAAAKGSYRLGLPAGASPEGLTPDEDGRLWLRDGDRLALRGGAELSSVRLTPESTAAVLRGVLQRDLPEGLSYEAESNWTEEGGVIRVSNGGHRNTSGSGNLWAWNTAGHALTWDIEVPTAGRYDVWLVCATETGLLAELHVDNGPGNALWFEPTGGWGRKNASEWRAFRITARDGSPAPVKMTAGRHRLKLTNRMGMGLNVDRVILAPPPGV